MRNEVEGCWECHWCGNWGKFKLKQAIFQSFYGDKLPLVNTTLTSETQKIIATPMYVECLCSPRKHKTMPFLLKAQHVRIGHLFEFILPVGSGGSISSE